MRVAVLGQGSIGRRHVGILKDLGHEVASFDPAGTGTVGSPEEALDGAGAAVVASPSSEHERQALAAISAGVPVLVEKPLALDASGARRVAEAASTAGVAVDVAMNLRHHPGVLAVRELLPRIGAVARASAWCGSWLPGWRPGTDYRASYSAQRALGGGVLLDAIHEIDYVLWLLGPALDASGMTAHESALEIDVEDVAHVYIRHAGGALSSIALDYLDRDYHRGCRIVGDEGTLDWDWTRGTVRLHSADGATEEAGTPADASPTYGAQMKRFLAVAAGEAEPLVGAAGGVAALEVVDAVRGGDLRVRPAGAGDEARLLEWRNDETVRAVSRSTDLVSAAEHAAWFAARLADPNTHLVVAEVGGVPVGTIRVNRLEQDRGEIHVALAAEARGRGLGTRALRAAARDGASQLGLAVLEAHVRKDNASSLAAFGRAGFARKSEQDGMVRLEWTLGE